MSKTVDQRVVEMRFDNKNFESNVSTTMSTLDKLKQKLNLTGASKGLEEINASAKKVDMSGLGGAVETVSAKFSALQVMGVTALANITNSAVNAGKRMASALTIDPIKSGFQEYETQINAVQTILANTESKGSTLQDVNRALDELNTYADKTIYNFTEMTRNIGTFTAAGVELDTAVSAIQGIANLAAVSGSTSQQASTAMYQLSQALSSGTVKLMDWNSVVNAGMGGQVFQDALKQTARVHGIAIDDMIKKEGSFRETLSNGWLTSDILTETLKQFTMAAEEGTEEWETYKKSLMDTGYTEEQAISILKMANTATDAATKVKTFTQLWDTLKEAAQSGWTQSWEIMIGDFEEAKDFLTDISNRVGEMIGSSADSRNKMLSEGLSSGWKQLLNAGIADEEDYKESIKSVAKEHGVAIDDMIKSEKELDESLTDGEAFQKVLKKGLKEGTISSDMLTESVHKMAEKMSSMSAEELKAAGYTADHVEQIKELSAGLKDGSISMDDFAKKMTRASGRENIIQALWNSFDGLMGVITPIKEAFSEIFPPMTGDQLYDLTVKIRDLTENFKISETTAENIKRTFKGVFAVLDIGVNLFKSIGKGAIDLIKNFSGLSGKLLENTASLGDYLLNLRDTITSTDIFGNAVEKVVGIISLAINKIKEFCAQVNSGFNSNDSKGIFNFFTSLWNIITNVGMAIAKTLGSVGKTISDFLGKGDILEVLNSGLIAGILLGVRNFSKSLKDGVDSVGGVLENVRGILDDVRGCLQAYQDQLKAGTLLKIASAIGILAASIFVISTIDPDKLNASLGAITVMFVELIGSLAILQKIPNDLKGTTKIIALMIGMSVAVLILSNALKKISSIDFNGIVRGLTGIAGVIGVLIIAAKTMDSDYSSITKFAGQMILMSVAIGMLSLVVKSLSSMSWTELAKGGAGILGITVTLVAAAKIMNSGNKAITKFSGQMIGMSIAIGALVLVAKTISSMSWAELAKSGAGLLGLTVLLVAAAKIMDSNYKSVTKFSGQLIGMSIALAILTPVLKSLGSMSWEEIGKGLVSIGGALAELAIGLNLMKGAAAGSAALIIASVALAMIAPVMKTLGGLSWKSIAKGLISLAGAFAVIGVAGLLLAPIIPSILGLAAAFALFGVSTALIGAGLLAISVGFTALATAGATAATAFVAAITVIIVGILDLVPTIAKKIGEGIVEICKVIGDYAPQIADSLLKLVFEVLKSLATYTPQILDSLLTFIIGVINSLADHMPTLIQAVMNLIGSLIRGVIDALNGLNTENLLKGIAVVGLMAGLMYALSGVASLTGPAMAGLLGVGLVIAELSLVLAAIGALSQIPGLQWLIEESGNFLEKIGTAIGQFIGGIAGGIAKGFTSSLPEIGSDLSDFMTNIQPFIEGAKNVDGSMLSGVISLSKAIMVLTAADILNGIASFITGGSSLSDFAKQLTPFGEAMKEYSDSIIGIDSNAVTSSAIAAKSLAELANNLPNSGGLVSLFAGENELSSFATQLAPFGKAMKEYSNSISGLDSEAVVSSANAALALSELATNLPNSGGLVSLFTGDNSLVSFALQLVPFGKAMKSYAESISGLDSESVIASTNAAKTIAELANNLPNSDGLIGLLTGENDLSTFALQLIPFGKAMKSYAESISGIDIDAVTSSANAAKTLSELANNLPNSGGLVSLLSGDNSLVSFAHQLAPLGRGMKAYSESISGIDTDAVTSSANAAKTLSELATNLPNSGGLVSLFTGENSLISFAWQLVPLGKGIKAYADSIAGIDMKAVTASANAAKSLSELATNLPNSGGLISLFTGENSLSLFAWQLAPLGKGMKAYADSVVGINPDAVTASANAAKTLSELATNLPNSGGLVSLFVGENNLSSFAYQLVPFGKGMKAYAESVSGIDAESVTASATAAKSLSELATNLPNAGGLVSLFTGENSIASFGLQLVPFGKGMKAYADAVSGIDSNAVTSSTTAAKSLSELATNLPNSGGLVSLFTGDNNIASFAWQLVPFGKAIKTYADAVTGIDSGAITSSVNAAKNLVTLVNSTAGIDSTGVSSFVNAINKLGETQVNKFIEAFNNSSGQISVAGSTMVNTLVSSIQSNSGMMTTAANSVISTFVSGLTTQTSRINSFSLMMMRNLLRSIVSKSSIFNSAGIMLMTKFASGISSQKETVMNAVKQPITSALSEILGYYSSFHSAGSYLVDGFADGISANTFRAEAEAVAMAEAALQAARAALGVASPSKEFYKIGDYAGQGFINALSDYDSISYDSSYGMADYARRGLSDAISKIQDVMNSDMDAQPTIRPVLDLSNVRSGAATIGSLFSGGNSIGVMANVGSIGSMMNRNNQNGTNRDVVSAIEDLKKDLKNVGGTSYSINGITYDDGSAVSRAIQEIVRAANIERRA